MILKRLFFTTITTSLLLLQACNDDEPKDQEYFFNLDSYFTIENGEISGSTFPAASDTSAAPVIESLSGANIIPEGGANAINVEASEPVKAAYVGVVNQLRGYYTVGTSSAGAVESFSITPEFISNPDDKFYFIKVAVMDEDDFISAYDSIKIVTVDAILGNLDITCTWDQPVDIDLYLVEPRGDTVYFDNPVSEYYGRLNHDSNPFCWIDGLNEETISYDINSAIQTGTYKVLLRYLSNCDNAETVNYSVEVRHDSVLIDQAGWDNPTTGTFTNEDISNGPFELFSFTIDNSIGASMKHSVIHYDDKNAKSLSPKKSALIKERK